MRRFTITESKWARGQRFGDCNLLNEQGNMCCLGFLCEHEGAKLMEGQGLPHHIANLPESIHALLDVHDGETLEWSIAKVNDDTGVTDDQRKEKLALLFAKIGFEPVYV